jgi:branched-chain amino acid transport system substrate-binding protein
MRRGAVVLGLLALLLAGCGGQAAAPPPPACVAAGTCVEVGIGQPVYLGALLSLERESGIDALQSVRLALDYLDGAFDGSPGRLAGHDVVLLAQDDACNAVGGRTGALRLLAEADLVAVIGTSCSSAALGAADQVLAEAGVPLISPSNTAPALTDPERRVRTYFRTAFNDALQGAVVADFAVQRQGWRRVAAVVQADEAYSEGLGSAFADTVAVQGGQTRQIAYGGPETIAAVLDELRADRPEAVFLPLFSPACEEVAAALRGDPALRRVPIVVAEACQTEAFLTALGPDARGVYASGPDFAFLEDNAFYREAFLPAYRQQTGGDPIGVFHPAAFDAASLIVDAVRRSARRGPGGSLLIDREEVRRALLSVQGYAGLSGRLSCLPSGDCAEGARIALYRAPAWPVADPTSAPVFSQAKSLAQIRGGG